MARPVTASRNGSMDAGSSGTISRGMLAGRAAASPGDAAGFQAGGTWVPSLPPTLPGGSAQGRAPGHHGHGQPSPVVLPPRRGLRAVAVLGAVSVGVGWRAASGTSTARSSRPRRWPRLRSPAGSAPRGLFAGRTRRLRRRRRVRLAEFAGRLGRDGRRSRLGRLRSVSASAPSQLPVAESPPRPPRDPLRPSPTCELGFAAPVSASRGGRIAAGVRGSGGGGRRVTGAGRPRLSLGATARIAAVPASGSANASDAPVPATSSPDAIRAGSRGDAHSRSHVVTTPHGISSSASLMLRSIVAQTRRTVCWRT